MKNLLKCPYCDSDLIWTGDYDLDDVYPLIDSEGIVHLYSCNHCGIIFDMIRIDGTIVAIIPNREEE